MKREARERLLNALAQEPLPLWRKLIITHLHETGLTYKYVAKLVRLDYVKFTKIIQYENTELTNQEMKNIAYYYGYSVSDLLKETEPGYLKGLQVWRSRPIEERHF